MRRVVFDPTYGGFVGEIPPAKPKTSTRVLPKTRKARAKAQRGESPTNSQKIGEIPANADPSWLKTEEFRVPFGYWRTQLYARRDVFLGYCSSSRATAASLKYFLQSTGA